MKAPDSDVPARAGAACPRHAEAALASIRALGDTEQGKGVRGYRLTGLR
jgi:hypothetical protein